MKELIFKGIEKEGEDIKALFYILKFADIELVYYDIDELKELPITNETIKAYEALVDYIKVKR